MFEFTSNPQMYTSAYNVINKNNYWNFLKEYNPPPDRGFMWDNNKTCEKIMSLINDSYDGHSAKDSGYSTLMPTQSWTSSPIHSHHQV